MFQVTWLDVAASLLWLAGASILIASVAAEEPLIALLSILPIAAAVVATVLAWLRRFVEPLRESAELADAVVRVNGQRPLQPLR